MCPNVPVPNLIKYGLSWDQNSGQWSALNIELYCFQKSHPIESGGLGRAGHFRRAVNMLWGQPSAPKRFIWHPWAEKMLEAACEHQYLAVAGCANSGKSEFFAVWAIVNFLSALDQTMVLVTSTSLKESRKRIWGSIHDYWQALPAPRPGKLVDSVGMIRLEVGGGKFSDRCGIALVAAEKKKEKEAVGKLIGIKNQNVILILDEMPEISEAVLEAGRSNLSANPNFQLVGLGNPASYYDAFGILCTPRDGWGSISVESDEWETELGHAIRFDATKSPNVLAGETLYSFLPTQRKLDEKKEMGLDENSLGFWRMMRGFWAPVGNEDAVYSESDIVKCRADQPVEWGTELPVCVAALDPAFTPGGDRCILYLGKVGASTTGVRTLWLDRYVQLQVDVTNKEEPPSYQLVRQFRAQCEAYGVEPKNAAFDATGAGGSFGDVVAIRWSPEVLRVQFGGAASMRPVSLSDRTPGRQRYGNRVSELWFGGKELLRSGQLRGVSRDLILEMTARRYSTRKAGGELRLEVERKVDMKLRTGKSPDIADAVFIMVSLCVERLHLSAVSVGENAVGRPASRTWRQLVARKSLNVGRRVQLRAAW